MSLAMKQVLPDFLKSNDAIKNPPAKVIFLVRLLNSDEVVQIKVRRDLVFERSAAIALRYKRTQKDVVDMTHQDPRLVGDYIILLSENSAPKLQLPIAGGRPPMTISRIRYMSLSSLYFFCVEMRDQDSAAIVFDAIVDLFHFVWPNNFKYPPGPDMINHVYKFSQYGDPLRHYLADCYIDFADDQWWDPELEYHPEFVKNVLLGILKRRDLPKGLSTTADPRNYLGPKLREKPATNPTTQPKRPDEKGLKRRRMSM